MGALLSSRLANIMSLQFWLLFYYCLNCNLDFSFDFMEPDRKHTEYPVNSTLLLMGDNYKEEASCR